MDVQCHVARPHCHDTLLRYAVTLQVCTHPYSSETGTGRKTKSMLSRQHAAIENRRAEGFPRLTFVDEWGRLSRHEYCWAVSVCDANPVHVRLIAQQSRGRYDRHLTPHTGS